MTEKQQAYEDGYRAATEKICEMIIKWGKEECITRGVDPDTPAFTGKYDTIQNLAIAKLAFAEIAVQNIRDEILGESL